MYCLECRDPRDVAQTAGAWSEHTLQRGRNKGPCSPALGPSFLSQEASMQLAALGLRQQRHGAQERDRSGGNQAECIEARDGKGKVCTGHPHRASYPEVRPGPFLAQIPLWEAGAQGTVCVPVRNKCLASLLSAPTSTSSLCFATGSTRCWTGAWGSRVRPKTTFPRVPSA